MSEKVSKDIRLKAVPLFYLADVILCKFSPQELKNITLCLPHTNINNVILDYFNKNEIKVIFQRKKIFSDFVYYFYKNLKINIKIFILKYLYNLLPFIWPKYSNKKLKNRTVILEFAYIQNKIDEIIDLKEFNKEVFFFCDRTLKTTKVVEEQLEKTNLYENFFYLNRPILKNYKAKILLPSFKDYKADKKNHLKDSFIKNELLNFNYEKYLWKNFFLKTESKVYVTSFFSPHTVAASKAIQEIGGASIYIQQSFTERPAISILPSVDVFFHFTPIDHFDDFEIKNQITHFVQSSYVKDYNLENFKNNALQLRTKLTSQGVKKVISFFDQGYGSDKRWTRGHEVSRKNYEFFLNKVIDNDWIGLIIKPKRPAEPYQLLMKAIKTGRCIIFDKASSGHIKQFENPPPMIAQASDVCVHEALDASTAGIECIIAGTNTLFFDDCGISNSNILEFFKGNKTYKKSFQEIKKIVDPYNDRQTFNRILEFSNKLSLSLSEKNNSSSREMIIKDVVNEYRIR